MTIVDVKPIAVVPTSQPLVLSGTLDLVPVGFAVNSVKASPEGGESVSVLSRGFYTSDNGPELYTYLDQLFVNLLGKIVLSAGVRIEQIDNCLVNVTRGTDVKIWINFPVTLSCIAKHQVTKGQQVSLDDLADVRAAHFTDVELPTNGSIAYTFRHGWRRGFYFHFEEREEPLNDLPKLFGSMHAALLLRERIGMNEDVLAKMASAGWFPFIRLPHQLVISLYNHFEAGWDPSDVEKQIVRALSADIQAWTKAWARKHVFDAHISAIQNAARLYENGDFMAASALLLPKIEGLLRHLHLGKGRATARSLRSNLLERVRAEVHGSTAYLPEAFIQYLETSYYASFDLETNTIPPSRHAFAHGVGPDEQTANPVFCMRLFLTLDQLFFYV